MRNGDILVLNHHDREEWFHGDQSIFVYSLTEKGNMVFPNLDEHPFDVVEKINNDYW